MQWCSSSSLVRLLPSWHTSRGRGSRPSLFGTHSQNCAVHRQPAPAQCPYLVSSTIIVTKQQREYCNTWRDIFLTALLTCNWHSISCTFFKVQFAVFSLMYIHTYESCTTNQFSEYILYSQFSFVIPLFLSPLPSPGNQGCFLSL